MITRHIRTILLLLAVSGLLNLLPGSPNAREAESVKLGEAALRFAGGSIRQSMPQDGIVNLITGDNQTAGNRMVLGWGGSDVLYLKLRHVEDAAVGDLYTIYKRVHKVFHPRTKNYMGYVVNMLAVVRVIQVDHGLTTVRIVRSFSPISPGDPVMRFVPPPPNDLDNSVGEYPTDTEGMIVDLQADKNMSLVGQGNLVYLDLGREQGLRPGDRMEVHRLGGSLPRRKVAEIKILSTEEQTATAVITKSLSRVLVGDRVQYTDHTDVAGLHSSEWLQDGSVTTMDKAEGSSLTGIPAVRVEPATGKIRINLEELVDQLEYDSGEVKIKPAGLPILDKIAEYLKTAASDKQIRVEGHADDMEIGPSLKSLYATNWELSRARADGIVRHLVTKGGMDSAKLTAVGYGSSRPVASNTTENGRKLNRRIEIVLYEAAGTEPDVTTSGATGRTEIRPAEQISSSPTALKNDVTSAITSSSTATPPSQNSADSDPPAPVVPASETPQDSSVSTP